MKCTGRESALLAYSLKQQYSQIIRRKSGLIYLIRSPEDLLSRICSYALHRSSSSLAMFGHIDLQYFGELDRGFSTWSNAWSCFISHFLAWATSTQPWSPKYIPSYSYTIIVKVVSVCVRCEFKCSSLQIKGI